MVPGSSCVIVAKGTISVITVASKFIDNFNDSNVEVCDSVVERFLVLCWNNTRVTYVG